MTQIQIKVQGSASSVVAAEVGVVHAAVTAEGPDPDRVRAQVVATVARVRPALDALRAQGVVTDLAVDQVRLSSHRPWHEQGEPLPLVHTATVSVVAAFVDFAALGRWVLTPGLSVGYVDWQVQPATRLELERTTRQDAVREAVTRAQDYSDALGLGPVTIRAIREPGTGDDPVMMTGALAASDALDLRPHDIEITAEVRASFTAELVSGAPAQ